jgi:hypothetical protein
MRQISFFGVTAEKAMTIHLLNRPYDHLSLKSSVPPRPLRVRSSTPSMTAKLSSVLWLLFSMNIASFQRTNPCHEATCTTSSLCLPIRTVIRHSKGSEDSGFCKSRQQNRSTRSYSSSQYVVLGTSPLLPSHHVKGSHIKHHRITDDCCSVGALRGMS